MTEKKEKLGSVFTLDNFSSTAKLADNELKPPLGSVTTINEKDGMYQPYDHRDVEHPNTDLGALVHLLKSSLGTGILAMPSAFKNGGLVVGAVGTLLVGFICTHCVHILVKCSHELCIRSKTPSMGFAETSEAAFKYGPERVKKFSGFAKNFVDVALVLTYYSGNCVYVVFIAENLEQVIRINFDINVDIRIYMAILFIPLCLICQIRELKFLVPFSMIANVLIAGALAITLYFVFSKMNDLPETQLYTSAAQLPMFFSTVIFAMEGIGVVMPVENSMKKPQHFLGCPGVLNTAMATVVLLYAVIGFFGYLCYGAATEPSITLSLPDNWAGEIAKISIAIAIFFTYALQFYVPMDITWNKVVKPRVSEKWHGLAQVSMRTIVVALTVIVAIVVRKLGPFIGLVGAVFFSILGLLVPSIVETVTYWEYDLGRGYWKLWKNICLSLLAIIALISGSYTSILEIIQES